MTVVEAVIYVQRMNPLDGENVELEVAINGTCSTYVPAKLHGPPDKCYPAEGGEAEITEAKCTDEEFKHLFDQLSSSEEDKAKEALLEAYSEMDLEYSPDYDDFNAHSNNYDF